MMHFRNKSIADSVTERISAIADSVRNDAPMPAARGGAVVTLNRDSNGDLMVTKTFDNGETELLTISNTTPTAPTPQGFVDVTPGGEGEGMTEQLSAGVDSGGIVESAALGGDSLDALLGN